MLTTMTIRFLCKARSLAYIQRQFTPIVHAINLPPTIITVGKGLQIKIICTNYTIFTYITVLILSFSLTLFLRRHKDKSLVFASRENMGEINKNM